MRELILPIVLLLATPSSQSKCPGTDNRVPSLVKINPNSSDHRVDCHPDPGAFQQKCEERGCLWDPVEEQGRPWCHYPQDYGYILQGEPLPTDQGWLLQLSRSYHPAMFGEEAVGHYIAAWLNASHLPYSQHKKFKISAAQVRAQMSCGS